MTEATDSQAAPAGQPAVADADAFGALRAGLPEELRTHPALSPYTSLEGLARSHVAAQRMIGKRIEDASPEDLARFHSRHGRPETADGYDFGLPADSGGREVSGALEQAARSWFHEAGLSQHQAEVLHRHWTEFAGTHAREAEHLAEETRAAAERELRGEWGRAYERRVAAAARAVAEFGGTALAEYLDETGLGNDPRLVRAFAGIADQIGEDSLVGEGDAEFAVAPDAARAEIARRLREPAYFDANHPDHAESVERMRMLFAAAYPEVPR